MPNSENGTPFLLAFRTEPGLGNPAGAKLSEEIGFVQALETRVKGLGSSGRRRDCFTT